MNYIWDMVIRAERNGLDKKNIKFLAAGVYSPYMELSYENINNTEVQQEVEINPYYRYDSIFKDFLDVNYSDERELRETLFDILIHLLTDIDIVQGMNKKEYYMRFVLRDIDNGIFGNGIKEKINYFNKDEKEIIAGNIIRIYGMGEAIYLFKDTVKKIFKKSLIYANREEKDELIVYAGQKKNHYSRQKMELIRELFLPVGFHAEIYWEHHFGIIGFDEVMMIDSIALY